MSQPVPVSWELREEQAANAANLQVDLVLNDKLEALEAEQAFEVEELSFAEELTTMPVFSAVPVGLAVLSSPPVSSHISSAVCDLRRTTRSACRPTSSRPSPRC